MLLEIPCLKMCKNKSVGKRKSDQAKNTFVRINRVDRDITIETDEHIYRLKLSALVDYLQCLIKKE